MQRVLPNSEKKAFFQPNREGEVKAIVERTEIEKFWVGL